MAMTLEEKGVLRALCELLKAEWDVLLESNADPTTGRLSEAAPIEVERTLRAMDSALLDARRLLAPAGLRERVCRA
jgi:hypothetical protein